MWKRFALGALAVIALTAAATATAALLQVKQFADTVFVPQNRLHFGSELVGDPGGPETFLIIGSDKRAKSTAIQDRRSPPHSDTLMLVRMDPDRGQTSILSIPRDLQVNIDGPNGPLLQKINSAYSLGGSHLTLRTVKDLLHIQINHVVDVNFAGFRAAVTAVGCVYVDVDHRYFNQNIGTVATNYSSINLEPGYQRLCGDQALSYVRYRHTDSDFVRVARQQDFIRQFKAQVGVKGLLDHASQLEHVGGLTIQTDIHGTVATLKLLKLLAFSLSRPLRQVPFRATPGPSYVYATPEQIAASVRDFLYGPARPRRTPSQPVAHRGRRAGAARALGLAASSRASRHEAASVGARLPFPVYYPRLVLGPGGQDEVRRYALRDEQGHIHHAYRIVFSQGLIGDYYGIEGMDWTNPPLLTLPSTEQTIGGRQYELFYDGSRLRWVAWRTPRAVYWVSNTLVESLSQRQLLAIAESAAPLT